MLAKLSLIFIALYRKVSAGMSNNCRYHPTCSSYSHDAIVVYGVSGLFIALIRIFRCNQLFPGGYDPII